MPTQRIDTRIEVLPDGQLQVRESLIVTLDDGTELPPVHNRQVVDVDTTIGNVPWRYGPDLTRLRAVRDAVHTPEVVAARRAARQAAEDNLPGPPQP